MGLTIPSQRLDGDPTQTQVLLIDPSTRLGKTGILKTNCLFRVYNTLSGISTPQSSEITWTEIDAAGAPGMYWIALASSALNDLAALHALSISPAAGVSFQPAQVLIETLAINSSEIAKKLQHNEFLVTKIAQQRGL